jgi:hypothetical protein
MSQPIPSTVIALNHDCNIEIINLDHERDGIDGPQQRLSVRYISVDIAQVVWELRIGDVWTPQPDPPPYQGFEHVLGYPQSPQPLAMEILSWPVETQYPAYIVNRHNYVHFDLDPHQPIFFRYQKPGQPLPPPTIFRRLSFTRELRVDLYAEGVDED